MRHLYECPLRWGDMDVLGHVNNVVYVDYLQEARVDLLRAHGREARTGQLAEGLVVVRHAVTYLAPLTFRFRPVSIECWVTEIRAASFTMAYEIFDEGEDGRTVYLRATTVLTPYVFETERPRRITDTEKETLAAFLEPGASASPPIRAVPRTDVGHYALPVRFSDVDIYGHVNNVKYFLYFQEARIRMMSRLAEVLPEDGPRPAMVVAQTDVEYRRPILFRQQPYDVWTSVARVGRKSTTFESEIVDPTASSEGDSVLARARVALVFFDAGTQRAVEPVPAYRDALLALAPADPGAGPLV